MRSVLPLLLILPLAAAARAGDIHVPGDYPTIQQAIQAAASGDRILVAPGVYTEDLDLLTKDLVLQSTGGSSVTFIEPAVLYTGPGLVITGGQTPATRIEGFTFRSAAGAIWASGSSPIIRDNTFDGNGRYDIHVDSAVNVLIERNVFRTTATDTLAIELVDCDGEVAHNTVRDHPGGCLFSNGSSSVYVHHNIFKDSGNYGGWAPALMLYTAVGDSSRIERNLFLRNHGPAIEAGSVGGTTDAQILNNYFLENDYGPKPSILAAGLNTGTLVFEGNYCRGPATTAGYVSSFIRNDVGTLQLRNNVFSRNQDTDPWLSTDAVATASGTLVVENCLFHELEIAAAKYSPPLAVGLDSILWDMSVSWQPWNGWYIDFQYSDVGPVAYGGGTNMNLDPMFVDAASGDYHLLAGSPCIDAVSGGTSVTIDADGRLRDADPDLGPYEYTGASHWFIGAPEGGATMKLVVQGQPGDAVTAGHSRALRSAPRPTPYGDLWLDSPYTTIPLGTIGANGILEVSFTASAHPLPETYYTQVLVGSVLTPVQELTMGG